MIKVGPAFFDSLSKDNTRRRSGRGDGSFSEILNFFPILLFAFVFLAIILRLFYVQVIQAGYYRGLSESNRTRTEVLPAPRGVIFDRSGKPLVANTAVYMISDGKNKKIIPQDEALKLISEEKRVFALIRREYVHKAAFAHVLGYVGQISEEQMAMSTFDDYYIHDLLGKMGIEEQYEKMLHGQNGKRLYEVDSLGNFVRELGRSEPSAGRNLTTTLDLDVQLSVSKAFEENQRGAAVVSDPRTGAILALYSAPSFDPNVFIAQDYESESTYKTVEDVISDSENKPFLNRAIGGAYPPGSTFKLITAIAALEKGKMKPDTKIEDTGILKVGDFSFGNWYFLQYGRKDGEVDVVKAITRSNDIFFYKAAESAGVNYISSWAEKFGLGKRLGIDLPGEVAGTIPTTSWKEKEIGEQWYLGDTYHYGIGQGFLLATPLQVNTFTNVFANRGTFFEPHILSGSGKVIKKDFLKSEYVDLVRRGMEGACATGGTGYPFFDFKVENARLLTSEHSDGGQDYVRDASAGASMVRIKVGCKTGTAETGGEDVKPHAWITVFAPYHNPEVSVTVLVENGGEGSQVAGPIAKKILQDYFEKKK